MIFLYGTLRHDALFTQIAGPSPVARQEAVLPDHAVLRAPGGPWPTLVARPDAEARGVVVDGLDAAQLRALDAYELPFGYVRRPVTVTTANGPLAATAYFPPPGQPDSGRPWSLDDWIAADSAAAIMAAAEIDWSDPALDHADLRRQWPMVRMRAAARRRAETEARPATLRKAPAAADWSVAAAARLAGSFFRFAAMTVAHRRFDGGHHRDLPREVLVGADAALVLPYDPRRDRVLLVEQFRAGPARRGDANPWTLEPVAGIVDADETPEAAALRESAEEAWLHDVTLEHMFSVYASPGSTTDHFYCYAGLCDLPDGHAVAGGLAHEAEDLRLHVIGFDRALALVDSGEVTAAPLAAMLLWLARARPRLRAKV